MEGMRRYVQQIYEFFIIRFMLDMLPACAFLFILALSLWYGMYTDTLNVKIFGADGVKNYCSERRYGREKHICRDDTENISILWMVLKNIFMMKTFMKKFS
jgi:hypothetical protein